MLREKLEKIVKDNSLLDVLVQLSFIAQDMDYPEVDLILCKACQVLNDE